MEIGKHIANAAYMDVKKKCFVDVKTKRFSQ